MIKTMKHEMKFAVLALLLALCFATTGCVQTTVPSDAKDESKVAAKELIKKDVTEENQNCPMDLHNGVIYTSVEYDEDANVVTYKYMVDSFDDMDAGDNALKETVLGALVAACDNDDTIAYFKAVVETGTNLVYRYSTDDDYRELVIRPSDLKSNLPQLQD